MAIQITMPALSPTMEEGTLATWLVKEGDTVSSGDVIAEIETDKATMEVESIDDGVVAKLLVDAGTDNVAVGTLIAVLAEEGEDPANVDVGAPAAAPAPAAAEPEVAAPASEAAPAAPVESTPVEMDVPAGTPMSNVTVREALRDAMAEEMRRDADVFVMGEEVAEYKALTK